MKRLVRKNIAVVIFLCVGYSACAQYGLPKFEFGANIGALVYQGDLTPERFGSFKTQKIFIGLNVSRIMSRSLSFRTNIIFGKLKGDEAKYSSPLYRQQRNLNFITPVTELSGQLVWNVTGRNYSDEGFSPYLFAGAGFSFLKITRDWSGVSPDYFVPATSEIWTGLAADAAHKLPRIIPVIPIGAGMRYMISPNWIINAEVSYRIGTTDYLDGFSKAVNPDKKDNYLGYSVGLIYRAGKKNRLGCPGLK